MTLTLTFNSNSWLVNRLQVHCRDNSKDLWCIFVHCWYSRTSSTEMFITKKDVSVFPWYTCYISLSGVVILITYIDQLPCTELFIVEKHLFYKTRNMFMSNVIKIESVKKVKMEYSKVATPTTSLCCLERLDDELVNWGNSICAAHKLIWTAYMLTCKNLKILNQKVHEQWWLVSHAIS